MRYFIIYSVLLFTLIGCSSTSTKIGTVDPASIPDSVNFYPDKALLFVSNGIARESVSDYIGAIHEFNKALLHDSSSVTIYSFIATNHMRLGEMDSAIGVLLRGIKNTKDNLELYRMVGEIYFQKEDYYRAAEYLKFVVVQNDHDVKGWRLLSAAYLRDGKLEEALSCYEAIISLGANDVEILTRYASLLTHMNRYEDAIDLYARVEARRPNDPLISFQIGGLYLELGDSTKADSSYKSAVLKAPDIERYWAIRIRLANAQGLNNKTYSLIDSSLLRNPGSVELLNLGAAIYSGHGNFQKAESFLKQSIDTDSTVVETYLNLGYLYHEASNFQAAEIAYKKGINLNPQDGGLLNNYAYLLAEAGNEERYSEALELVEQALTIDGERTSYLDTKGWIYFLLKQYENAEIWLKKAAERDDASSEIFDHLGDLYYSMNQLDEARKWWYRALEYGADRIEIEAKINRQYP